MTVLIGPSLDRLVRFHCPSEMGVDESPTAEFHSTHTGVFATVSPYRPPRTWDLDISLSGPHEVAALQQLLRAPLRSGRGLIWVSEDAAQVNGLTPAASAFHPDSLDASMTRDDAPAVFRDVHGQEVVAYSATVDPAVSATIGMGEPVVPIHDSPYVTVSVAALHDPATSFMLGVRYYDAAGVHINTVSRTAPPAVEVINPDTVITSNTPIVKTGGLTGPDYSPASPPLVRRWATFTPPAGAWGVRIFTLGATRLAAPAVTLTDTLAEYGEGDGAPEVVPVEHSHRALLTYPGRSWRSTTIKLQEVGRALR